MSFVSTVHPSRSSRSASLGELNEARIRNESFFCPEIKNVRADHGGGGQTCRKTNLIAQSGPDLACGSSFDSESLSVSAAGALAFAQLDHYKLQPTTFKFRFLLLIHRTTCFHGDNAIASPRRIKTNPGCFQPNRTDGCHRDHRSLIGLDRSGV